MKKQSLSIGAIIILLIGNSGLLWKLIELQKDKRAEERAELSSFIQTQPIQEKLESLKETAINQARRAALTSSQYWQNPSMESFESFQQACLDYQTAMIKFNRLDAEFSQHGKREPNPLPDTWQEAIDPGPPGQPGQPTFQGGNDQYQILHERFLKPEEIWEVSNELKVQLQEIDPSGIAVVFLATPNSGRSLIFALDTRLSINRDLKLRLQALNIENNEAHFVVESIK